ncbi:Lipopolysaccharide heptosyltransferase 1 [Gimesia alba]|uniref:Lipopolysaccharide heptosyltransferase 1 n=1 Tax=Gimesia alba TaxID=2527973 RepID=A0A517RF11_9PLAN|nr:glycosyltransferase family 9 protein [Gimesia alba]QDT42472.1 Lipopolysaccharide heptosyltransferase 1 [Gimesia alba]
MSSQHILSQLNQIEAKRICIIKPSALGDVVQTLPILPVLRERFPNAEISWIIRDSFANLLEGHPHINHIIPFSRRSSVRYWWSFLKDLKQRQFDLVLDLQGLLRTGIMTTATRAPWRIGIEAAREGSHLAYNLTIPDTGRLVPAYLKYWRVADALGLGETKRQTDLALSEEDLNWAKSKLSCQENRAPTLAIHAGAQWITKRWPPESFAAVGAKAIRHFRSNIVLVGTADERPLTNHIEQLLHKFVPTGNVINLAGETTLKQLAAVLIESDFLLTNDSGPMHLAAGLGTPVTGIFTCTSSLRSGPPGDQHELVSTNVDCAGSYQKRCPKRGPQNLCCMEELEIGRVWQALFRLITRHSAQRTGKAA